MVKERFRSSEEIQHDIFEEMASDADSQSDYSTLSNDKLIRLAYVMQGRSPLENELVKRLDRLQMGEEQRIVEIVNDHDSPERKAWCAQSTSDDSICITLQYFKVSGKYYSHGEMKVSPHIQMFALSNVVKEMRLTGDLPGLTKGAGKEFVIYIDASQHPLGFPILLTKTFFED